MKKETKDRLNGLAAMLLLIVAGILISWGLFYAIAYKNGQTDALQGKCRYESEPLYKYGVTDTVQVCKDVTRPVTFLWIDLITNEGGSKELEETETICYDSIIYGFVPVDTIFRKIKTK